MNGLNAFISALEEPRIPACHPKVLDTTVAYLSGEDEDKPTDEVMEMAKVLMTIKNENLRKAAFEQVKILAGLELV